MKYVMIIILIAFQINLKAQKDSVNYKKFSFNIGILGGLIKNKDVEDYIAKEADAINWQHGGKISDGLVGFSLGTSVDITKNIKISISEDYSSAHVNSHSKDTNKWGGYVGNDITYYYRRWTSNLLISYNYRITTNTILFASGGLNYSKLTLKKESWSSDPLAFSADSSKTIAKTWTTGFRLSPGLIFMISKNIGLEINIYKDFLMPKTINSLKLDYNTLGFELKMRLLINNAP